MNPEKRDEFLWRIEDAIRRTGWHMTGVSPTREDPPEAVPFSYTTGFRTTWGAPDLIISALPPVIAHGVAGAVVDLLKKGERIAAGDERRDVLEGFPARFQPVSDEVRLARMTACKVTYGREDFEALQLVWPNRDGLFPGDDGYVDADGGRRLQELFA